MIAKVQANRLKPWLTELDFLEQSAFVRDSQTETESLLVYGLIAGIYPNPWHIWAVIEDCKKNLAQFKKTPLLYCLREANHVTN